ncbi:hypothetical protein LDVICp225 [lymphocystis disease virus-China]|uniref:Uncharacterized protein n=2 Tax=Lymphocystis disease virus 2 TaxID=159183 RepID=A0A6F8X0Q1_9VIRU|nr:hypothetical protein LDVICp225 [lymphocystis disease virus-China]AAU11068.1 hypothetical protein [lymphocystis disease virus-China]BCB67544.1 hypothetical protein [Lymphocystis disease virus 2]
MLSRSVEAFLTVRRKIKEHEEAKKILKKEEKLLLNDIVSAMTEAEEDLIKVADDLYIYKEDKISYKTLSKKQFDVELDKFIREENISSDLVQRILNLKNGESVKRSRLKILNQSPNE